MCVSAVLFKQLQRRFFLAAVGGRTPLFVVVFFLLLCSLVKWRQNDDWGNLQASVLLKQSLWVHNKHILFSLIMKTQQSSLCCNLNKEHANRRNISKIRQGLHQFDNTCDANTHNTTKKCTACNTDDNWYRCFRWHQIDMDMQDTCVLLKYIFFSLVLMPWVRYLSVADICDSDINWTEN